MKFSKLYLKAYGPYSERLIDFESSSGSLHLVCGPNEAGKSSLLRAIRALLYGIEEKTRDNFLHENSTLRVGGLVVADESKRLAVMRRKGRKSTLREWNGNTGADCEGNVIADTALSELLGGLEEGQFGLLFGIDRDELIRGGDAILEGHGEVGESLFEAGAGLVGLRKLREAFEAEAAELFAPRASKPIINEAVTDFERARSEVKQAAVKTEEWAAREEACRSAHGTLEKNGVAIAERRLDVERLGRILRNLQPIARRESCVTELSDLVSIPELPLDFSERRAAATTAQISAERRKTDSEHKVANFETQLKKIVIPTGYVERAALIQGVQVRLPIFQKAELELPGIEAQQRAARERIDAKLRELGHTAGLDEVEKLRPKRVDQTKVRGLIKEHADVTGRLSELRRQEIELQAELEQAQVEFKKCASPRDGSVVVEALNHATALGDVERRFAEGRKAVARGKEDLERKNRALWDKTIGHLRILRLPSKATLDRLLSEAAAISTERKVVSSRLMERRGAYDALQAQKVKLEATGSVISAQDLQTARKHRENGWQFVRQGFIDRTGDPKILSKSYVEDTPLPEAYEEAVVKADNVSDTLRLDAQRVADHASAVERMTQIAGAIKEDETALADLDEREKERRKEWTGLVAALGIKTETVRELEEWLQGRERIVVLLEDLEEQDAQVVELERAICDASARIVTALIGFGVKLEEDCPFTSVLSKAKSFVEALARESAAYDEAKRSVSRLQIDTAAQIKRIKGVEAELSEWRSRWLIGVEPLGLGKASEPIEAEERVRLLEELFEIVDELRRLHGAVEVHSATIKTYSKEVDDLAHSLGVDSRDMSKAETVTSIVSSYQDAVRGDQDRNRLSAVLEQEKAVLAEAISESQRQQDELRELFRMAGVSTIDEFQGVEANAKRKRVLQTELHQAERQLVEQNGMPVERVLEEAASLDRDTLQVRITSLDQEIKEFDSLRVTLVQLLHDAELALKAVDGGAKSAEAAQRAQEALTRIRRSAEDYVRIKMSSLAIGKAIEAYRQKHQGPILKRASEYFFILTCQRFKGLDVDFGDDDQQVLVGLRNDSSGRRVRVEGMSDGTRDQLYLALRLAAIERYIESGIAVPLIVDDVLVQFDDDRSAAALKALAELSAKTQVLLFTHHEHLVQIAERTVPKDVLALHHLEIPTLA